MSRTRCNNKWTAEEETAFKNGIDKHGVGKWRSIIKDPEFSTALAHRTNTSLKDKWRNMNAAKGKSQNSYKSAQKKPIRQYFNESAAFTREGSGKNEVAQPDTPAIIYESSEDDGFDKLTSRFDDFKLDYLTNAKKPTSYMLQQEQLLMKRFLCGNSNSVAANGKINEVDQEMEYDSVDLARVMKAAVDAEVMRLRHMSPEDVAAAAAAAVKMAEVATAEAEEAVKEAEEAELLAEEKKSAAEELERKLEEMKAKAAAKNGKRGRSKW